MSHYLLLLLFAGESYPEGKCTDSASSRGYTPVYGHHIGLMYFGLFVFRLQVQVCQGVIVLSCIVIRPALPSELAIILDGTSSNPLEPHPDG